jgi:hypothetical protein
LHESNHNIFSSVRRSFADCERSFSGTWQNDPLLSRTGGAGRVLKRRRIATRGDICRVPAYLTAPGLDFPYQRKPVDEELMFTDFITAVRFLGGINSANIPIAAERNGNLDLAVRAADGNIQYLWNVLDRFDRYVNLFGREITIVLDNIPSAFVSNPSTDGYGQIAPPENYGDWTAFIQALCRELVRRYGFETVNPWRFRICTEGRIHTDTQGFCRHYDLTTQAVRSVLPGARFSAYNSAAIHQVGDQHINFYQFLAHAASGTNYATGKIGSPYDFAPVSYYSVPLTVERAKKAGAMVVTDPSDQTLCRWTISPEMRTAQDYKPYWDAIHSVFPSASAEIQELGILTHEQGDFTSEPGARGAAWLFDLLFQMKETCGIRRAWHWHVTDPVSVPDKPLAEQHRLLCSNGWLYDILDYTDGSDLFVLNAAPRTADRDFLLKCIGFKKAASGGSYIILSAFNIDRNRPFQQSVTIHLPNEFLDGTNVTLKTTVLNPDTDVYAQIRKDLDAARQLNPNISTNPNTLYAITPVHSDQSLATPEGRQLIDRNWTAYEKIIQDSLTLKPFPGTLRSAGDGFELVVNVKTPCVTVIRMKEKDEK